MTQESYNHLDKSLSFCHCFSHWTSMSMPLCCDQGWAQVACFHVCTLLLFLFSLIHIWVCCIYVGGVAQKEVRRSKSTSEVEFTLSVDAGIKQQFSDLIFYNLVLLISLLSDMVGNYTQRLIKYKMLSIIKF